jgi:DNA-binding CsgD family transcriptional regulator/tetratricopeptide (TPR) repeat protein
VDSVRRFEAAHRALAALGPTLVVVDDLHWADEATVALLHYCVRAAVAGRQPLAVVVASRPARSVGTVHGSLRELVGRDAYAEIVLGPLPEHEGTLLARELAPHLDDTRAGLLWRRARGSPFWLHLLAADEGTEADVDRVVRERLESAGGDAAAVAALLAVAGRPLAADDVAGAYAWAAERVDEAADALAKVGLLVRDTDGVALTHDLVRDAIRRVVVGAGARRLHRLLGRWLERDAGADDPSLLEALDHRRAGGDSVVALAQRLARSPRRRLLGAAGLARLLAVADEAGPEADGLLEALGELASDLDEHEVALRIWSGRSSVGRSDADLARASLRARRHAGGDRVILAEALAQESLIQRYLDSDPEASRVTALRALEMARPDGADAGPLDRLDAAGRRGWLRAALAAVEGALTSDDPEQMLDLADELASVAAGVDERIEVQALVAGSMALRFLGRNAEAEERLRQAWQLCRTRVLPESTIQAGTTLARVLVSLGRLTEADLILRECVVLGARVGSVTPVRAFGVILAGLLELSAGNWRTGVDRLRDAAAAEPNPHFRLQAHVELASALSRLDPGDSSAAVREAVTSALADADTAGCRRCRTETLVRCSHALSRTGAAHEAADLFRRAEVNPSDAHTGFWSGWARATLQAGVGDVETGAALERVVADAEVQGLHLEALWVRLEWAGVLVRGARERAVDVLTRACADAERMGATTELRVASRQLRALGVRAWRRGGQPSGPDPLDVLTTREREIAQQVATGASNPEIATAMFLSRKTVEHHVSNILGKLGLRNRAELAALAADDRPGPAPPAPRKRVVDRPRIADR